jgi:hypothetical protein
MDNGTEDAASSGVDGRWLSYAELAEARGVDKPSALKLALRKRWPRRKDNHGTMQVLVPPEWARPWGSSMPDDVLETMPHDADISRAINTLEAAVSTLTSQLEQANRRADKAEQGRDVERSRAERAEQSWDRAERERAAADTDRRAADARADKAEQANVVLREQIEATKVEVVSLQTKLATVEAEGAAEDIKTAELSALVKQARTEAEAAVQAADDLRQADEARRVAGLWTRLRRAWRRG